MVPSLSWSTSSSLKISSISSQLFQSSFPNYHYHDLVHGTLISKMENCATWASLLLRQTKSTTVSHFIAPALFPHPLKGTSALKTFVILRSCCTESKSNSALLLSTFNHDHCLLKFSKKCIGKCNFWWERELLPWIIKGQFLMFSKWTIPVSFVKWHWHIRWLLCCHIKRLPSTASKAQSGVVTICLSCFCTKDDKFRHFVWKFNQWRN